MTAEADRDFGFLLTESFPWEITCFKGTSKKSELSDSPWDLGNSWRAGPSQCPDAFRKGILFSLCTLWILFFKGGNAIGRTKAITALCYEEVASRFSRRTLPPVLERSPARSTPQLRPQLNILTRRARILPLVCDLFVGS